ncbi:MAG: hypothetical protein HC842_06625 [Cytophagales bacterium]|nr:hypothetical protein [Cytophagales bacterium]
MNLSIINLHDYTVLEHVLFASGCLLWVFTYVIIIQHIRKSQFIEIPLVCVAANFVWEFLWSFVFPTNMGELYVWGYRVWFFMDCYILYGLFRYGANQIDIPLLKSKFHFILVFNLLAWSVLLYFYIKEYDFPLSHMGAYAGYVLNTMMSAMYIPFMVRKFNPRLFSLPAAWYKGVGTLLISVFCFLHFTDPFLLAMCVVTGVLDGIYIYLFIQLKRTY